MNAREKRLGPAHRLEAKVVKQQDGLYLVIEPGKLKCGSCGNDTFRVVIDYNFTPHFYCTKCNCEHRIYLGEPGEFVED